MASSASNNSETPSFIGHGVVKQVLSGDSVIIRGIPKGGPPPERQINFTGVSAPRLGRKALNNQSETQDEPYAWASREFLRKKVIGKDVCFTIDQKNVVDTKSKGPKRQYGTIYLGKVMDPAENITKLMVSEGWLTVRKESIRGDNELANLEDAAKSQNKGRWGGNNEANVRNIKYTVENARTLVDKFNGKQVPAIIEHVRDGSTVRAMLMKDNEFIQVTFMISGIRCPNVKMDGTKPDPGSQECLGEEAKYYVESRLLQKDIHVILETSNNNNVVGSIIHPVGNIAEFLLKEGFAKCVDWSITTVTGGPEKLRAAERIAKQKKLKIWKDYKPTQSKVSEKDREFSGKVIEIVNGDALVILKSDNTTKKIFLASIKPPRLEGKEPTPSGKVFRPLFDIPLLFEAREFLRKKLIDQTVSVTVDYIQPAANNYPEKTCCTVKINNVNVAEAMVSKGFATVIRYRQDDDQRAACYDDLLAAEAKAIKGNKGLHNKKEISAHRVNDVSDPNKAKPYFSFLKRAALDAVPEFVASGSRMRVYIPRETCLVTFLLAGISCPRAPRNAPGGVGGTLEGEPFGVEALALTKKLVHQREVIIEVDSMDKGGNFIGWLMIDGKNLSVELVANGLASVHFSAESSKYYHALSSAENSAKNQKLNMWKNYTPEDQPTIVEETNAVRKVELKPMYITEITEEGKMYGQCVKEEDTLLKIQDTLRKSLSSNPPLPGAYTPKRGELCACKFSLDSAWYRAKVEKVERGAGKVHVYFVDYGNREITSSTKCAALPQGLNQYPAIAKEMSLAFVKFHKEEENTDLALQQLREETEGPIMVNMEYKNSGTEFVTLHHKDKTDINKSLLRRGLMLLDNRRDRRFKSILTEYNKAQDEAKSEHLNIWQYGDVTEDDAHEFGMER